jgi:hypothetical protein
MSSISASVERSQIKRRRFRACRCAAQERPTCATEQTRVHSHAPRMLGLRYGSSKLRWAAAAWLGSPPSWTSPSVAVSLTSSAATPVCSRTILAELVTPGIKALCPGLMPGVALADVNLCGRPSQNPLRALSVTPSAYILFESLVSNV